MYIPTWRAMSSSDVAAKPFSWNCLAAASRISFQRLGRATWASSRAGVVERVPHGRTVGWLFAGRPGGRQLDNSLVTRSKFAAPSSPTSATRCPGMVAHRTSITVEFPYATDVDAARFCQPFDRIQRAARACVPREPEGFVLDVDGIATAVSSAAAQLLRRGVARHRPATARAERSRCARRASPSTCNWERGGQLVGEGARQPLLVALERPAPIDDEQPVELGGHQRVDEVRGVALS